MKVILIYFFRLTSFGMFFAIIITGENRLLSIVLYIGEKTCAKKLTFIINM